MTEPVKPCPFCGSTEWVPSFHSDKPHTTVSVGCEDCDAEGPPVIIDDNNRTTSIEEARKRWNARK